MFCENGVTLTYNFEDKVLGGITYGGYSDSIVVDEGFVLKVSPKVDLAGTAPLLCAGITTYSPLRYAKVGKHQKVGIVGLGGLGHMGVKFAHAFGAHVVLFTTSPSKVAGARCSTSVLTMQSPRTSRKSPCSKSTRPTTASSKTT